MRYTDVLPHRLRTSERSAATVQKVEDHGSSQESRRQRVIAPSPTRLEVTVRRVRRKFIQQGDLARWLPPIAKKYGRVDEYDPGDPRFADAPLATPNSTKEGGALRFSQAQVMQPRLGRKGVILEVPDWFDMARNGWQPVQRIGRRCMDN